MAAVTSSTSPTLSDAVFRQLSATIRGDAIRPGEPSHVAARQVDNAMTDKRPALKARGAKVVLGVLSRCSGVDTRPSFRDTRPNW
ncbi:hypothetical protein BH20CHL3_BH20CHL3_00550 [soil metagenome]